MTSAPETARDKLDRLKQMADEAERDNPETPIAELLDLQRALRRTIPKMRALHAVGWSVNASALTDRIGGLLREMEELLSEETEQ